MSRTDRVLGLLIVGLLCAIALSACVASSAAPSPAVPVRPTATPFLRITEIGFKYEELVYFTDLRDLESALALEPGMLAAFDGPDQAVVVVWVSHFFASQVQTVFSGDFKLIGNGVITAARLSGAPQAPGRFFILIEQQLLAQKAEIAPGGDGMLRIVFTPPCNAGVMALAYQGWAMADAAATVTCP